MINIFSKVENKQEMKARKQVRAIESDSEDYLDENIFDIFFPADDDFGSLFQVGLPLYRQYEIP